MLVRVVSEVRAHWSYLAAVFALQLLAIPLLLLTPIPIKVVVDSVLGDRPLPGYMQPIVPRIFAHDDLRLLLFAAALQVVVVLLTQVQAQGAEMFRTVGAERMTLAFRARLFGHVQRLSFSFHDRRGTADSLYRIQYDAQSLQHVSFDGLLPVAAAGVSFATTVSVIARLSPQLAMVALVVSPPLFLLSRGYGRRVRPGYKTVRGLESRALNIIQEVLGSLRVVKAFGRERAEERRFVAQANEGAQARIRLTLAESAFNLLVSLTTATGTAAVLFLGVRNVQTGSLTLGELLMVLSYLTQLYAPLKTMSRRTATLQSSLAGAERAFELLDESPEVGEPSRPRRVRRAAGAVRFVAASFGYEPGHLVLHDINLHIAPGTRVGIEGPTGAGKTTLVGLLIRFYDPTSGAVLLDGEDLRTYALSDLREQFSMVLQDTILFRTTVAENIAYARPHASRREIAAAAHSANAHDFISALPDGYDTVVGERGMRLSGGERQRIALARAFLKNAPILILDEPTSSVDVATEALIMDAVARLMAGRTTFMIAHRLGTLAACDVRVRLQRGRIVEPTDLAPRDEISLPAGPVLVPAAGGRHHEPGGLSLARIAGLGRRSLQRRWEGS